MFNPNYPGWGCRCCESGDEDFKAHQRWNVYSAVAPRLAKKGATCRAEHRRFDGVLTPAECASKVRQRASCGPYFMFNPGYPGWGCRCCESAGEDFKSHERWNVYSADPLLSKKGATCRAEHHQFDGVLTPAECASK